MAERRHKRLAILSKIETTYRTDAAPAAADALIATNVTFSPMEGEEVNRDRMLPYLGSQGVILAGIYARLEFDIEAAGAGTAGDVPKYGSIMRACGLSETITAGTDVTYNIVEDDLEATSIYFVSDKVQHVMLGCRGNVSMVLNPKGIPYFRFTVMGFLGSITDIGAMPAVVDTGWTTPLIVNQNNTTLSLHTLTMVSETLSIDLGNTVTPRFLIGEEGMPVTDRQSSGSTVVTAQPIATVDWFAKATDRISGPMQMVHGIAAGNIVEVNGAAVEIGRPTQGQTDNIVNYTLPLIFTPNTGLDELEFVVR